MCMAQMTRWPGLVAGDIVNSKDESGEGSPILCTQAYIDSKKFSAFNVLLPMPGFRTIYPDNDMGKWFEAFVEKEGVDFGSASGGGYLSGNKGSYRQILERAHSLCIESGSDVLFPGGGEGDTLYHQLTFQFTLSSGSFATMFLREAFRKQEGGWGGVEIKQAKKRSREDDDETVASKIVKVE